MSLVSFNNFLAPFRNTVHIISMLLVALLFGIYRWSGGTVEWASSSRATAPSSVSSGERQQLQKLLNSNPTLNLDPKKELEKLRNQEDSASDLNRMIAEDPKKGASEGKAGNDALQDVERSLGLR